MRGSVLCVAPKGGVRCSTASVESGGLSRPAERRRSKSASGSPRIPSGDTDETVSTSVCSSVGSLLLPSAAFGCHQPGALEDITGSSLPGGKPPFVGTPDLPSPSKRPHIGRVPRGRSGAEAPSSIGTHPLLGFVTSLPLHRHILCASTPSSPELPRDCLRADGTTRPAPVPSSWFRTTSTAFSARRTVGLLHPTAGPGVRRVSRNLLPRPWPVACATSRDDPEVVPWDRGEEGLVPAT
jgi:hypothetical protein